MSPVKGIKNCLHCKLYSVPLTGLIGFSKSKKTVTATEEGNSIVDTTIMHSYIMTCADGSYTFQASLAGWVGEPKFTLLNGTIRPGYSIVVQSGQLLLKKADGFADRAFALTFYSVI